jgi:hypothetical protein
MTENTTGIDKHLVTSHVIDTAKPEDVINALNSMATMLGREGHLSPENMVHSLIAAAALMWQEYSSGEPDRLEFLRLAADTWDWVEEHVETVQ